MSTATATATVATVRTRRIVRALAAGTWSALETYGALVLASYGYPDALTDIRDRQN